MYNCYVRRKQTQFLKPYFIPRKIIDPSSSFSLSFSVDMRFSNPNESSRTKILYKYILKKVLY